MNEVIIKRLKESLRKTVLVFLHNDFRYTGELLNSDDKYFEIKDFKTEKIMVFEISEIKTLEVSE